MTALVRSARLRIVPPAERIKIPLPGSSGRGQVLAAPVYRCPDFPGHVIDAPETIGFCDPPSIRLDTGDGALISGLLAYAGMYSMPGTDAMTQGISLFRQGREIGRRIFTRQRRPARVRIDWDWTAGQFWVHFQGWSWASFQNRWAVIKTVVLHRHGGEENEIRALETARQGHHPFIFGLLAGAAISQGIQNFEDWNTLKPGLVGFSTATWPSRMRRHANENFPIVSLALGLFPGQRHVTDREIQESGVVGTIHHFFPVARALLEKFRDCDYDLKKFPEELRLKLLILLESGKADHLKDIETIDFMVDDSPRVAAVLSSSPWKTRVVCTSNQPGGGREFTNSWAFTVRGIRTALAKVTGFASTTDAPAVADSFDRLTKPGTLLGFIDPLGPGSFAPSPPGGVLVVCNRSIGLSDYWTEFEQPRQGIKRLVREGLEAVAKAHHQSGRRAGKRIVRSKIQATFSGGNR